MAHLHPVSPAPSADKTIADIIFVHGLGGEAEATWFNVPDAFDWTDWVAERFPECRVWKLSYASHAVFQRGMPYQDQAKAVLDALLNRGLGTHPIVFVCHSLGGILVKQALRASEKNLGFISIYRATKGIVFIATPHSGSSLANLLKFFLIGSDQARQLVLDEPSLRDLDEWFRQTVGELSLRVAAFAETRAIRGAVVVSPSSADPKVASCTLISLPADHISITKPSRKEMQLCESTARFIDACLNASVSSRRRGGRQSRLGIKGSSNRVNVPPRTVFFTGQSEMLESIDARLAVDRSVVLAGLQGVGKTQLAVEYAFQTQGAFQWTFWVNAESSETLLAGFIEMAKHMALPTVGLSQGSLISIVRQWFDNNVDWLLILDNLDGSVVVDEFLTLPTLGSILATSLSPTIPHFTSFVINEMPLDDAALLLLRRSGAIHLQEVLGDASNSHRDQARELASELGCLPLALDQAGAFIRESSSSLKEYKELYRNEGAILRALRGSTPENHASVSVTFSLAANKLKLQNPKAHALVTLCAFLGSESIPEEVVSEALKLISAQHQLDSNTDLELVQTYGAASRLALVRRFADPKYLQIHRLVQVVVRDNLSVADQRYWAGMALRGLLATLMDPPVDEDDRFDRAMPHVQHIADLLAQYNIEVPDGHRLLMRAGVRLHTAARYREAIELYKKGCDRAIHLFGEGHKDVALLLNNIGESLRSQGLYAEAETYCRRSLRIWDAVVGPRSFKAVATMNSLALICFDTGKLEEARDRFEDSLAVQETELGTTHADCARTMNNLATVYREKGDFDNCEMLCDRALQIIDAAGDEAWEDKAFTLANLASLARGRAQYQHAEELYREILNIREKRCERDHPSICDVYNNLALVYDAWGRYLEAEAIYRRNLEAYQRLFGAASQGFPAFATTLNNLTTIYNLQGRYTEAEENGIRAVTQFEKIYGGSHPDVAMALSNFAITYQHQGSYATALPLFERAVSIWKEALGSDHTNLATGLNNLGNLNREMGRYADAEPLILRAMDIWQNQFGSEYAELSVSLNNLGLLYYDQGKMRKADETFQRAYDLLAKTVPLENLQLQTVLENLFKTKRELGLKAEAIVLEERLRAKR